MTEVEFMILKRHAEEHEDKGLLCLVEQAEKANKYEKIIHNIANIDTIFINLDGTEREFNEKEALKKIESMVEPIWNEHCERSWKSIGK